MKSTRTGGRWLVAVLAACAALASGCAEPVDPDKLPGVYRNDVTGGEIVLDADRSFSVTDVVTDGWYSGPDDFRGEWEFLDNQSFGDCIYLTIDADESGLGMIGGMQLYTDGPGTVYFLPHPDRPAPPNMVFTRAAAT